MSRISIDKGDSPAFGLRLALAGWLAAFVLAGCSGARQQVRIDSATSDLEGRARVESAAGVVEFTVISGLTGERQPGARVSVAVDGTQRIVYAEDPTGTHLPVAAPLDGDATVRRLILPPETGRGFNLATASGALDLEALTALGSLSEEDIRGRLSASGDEAVLIYLYNPARPLALTGAPLEAFSTPFADVTVLRAAGEPPDAALGMVIAGIGRAAYDQWSNLAIDRYLAGRIGQLPTTDLRADLTFGWAYPVYQVFPEDATLDFGATDSLTLTIGWRSRYPDPPPPWSFFLSSDAADVVTITPESFALSPDSPPQEVVLTLDRGNLASGDYSVKLFIQPFSDVFGLIDQIDERELTFTVGEMPPTPTPGPTTDITTSPASPREGDMLVVTAGGFQPGEPVLIELSGPEATLRDALPTADQEGNFRYEINLASTPAGVYTLRLAAALSGITSETSITIAESVADAIVKQDVLNLRTGPSYDYPVLEVLAAGDELEVVGVNSDDSWIEVVTKTGIRGWVVTNLVDLNVDLATVPWNPNVPAP